LEDVVKASSIFAPQKFQQKLSFQVVIKTPHSK